MGISEFYLVFINEMSVLGIPHGIINILNICQYLHCSIQKNVLNIRANSQGSGGPKQIHRLACNIKENALK